MVGFPVSMVWGKRSIEVSEFVLAGPENVRVDQLYSYLYQVYDML